MFAFAYSIFRRGSCGLIALVFSAGPAFATTFTVTSTSGDPNVTGSLGWAINQANASSGHDTIQFAPSLAGQTIKLQATLPIISDSVSIQGDGAPGLVIDGASTYNIFFIRESGGTNPGNIDVTIANVTLQNGHAKGGDGRTAGYSGGGGMGAGGAVFVGKGANVTIEDVQIRNNQAQGGRGGTNDNALPGGGGGGLNGGNAGLDSGNNGGGGGGGYGQGSDGTDASGVNGGTGGGPAGGTGGTETSNAGDGGAYSGGGGGGASSTGGNLGKGGNGGFGGGGGGGGYGGGDTSTVKGGHGGFGGGGGGGGNYSGTGTYTIGGNGGFGGGGGGGKPAKGGFGGGDSNAFSGGGGAGMGGAFFVEDGGSIRFEGNSQMTGSKVTGGAAGNSAAEGGLGLGEDFYLHGTTGIIFDPDTGEVITVSGSIASDAYNDPDDPGNVDPAADGLDKGVTKIGAGTLVLDGKNTFIGGLHVSDGVVAAQHDDALGHLTGKIFLSNDGELLATGSFSTAREIVLSDGGTLSTNSPSDVLTINGQISGSGGLTTSGKGTVVLNGNQHSYSGGTTIEEGRLKLGVDNAIPSGMLQIAATGIFDMNGFDQVITALAGETGSQILLGAGTLTIDQSSNTTFSGTVTGSGDFIKQGAGTLDLDGALETSGFIRVQQGTLGIQSDDVLNGGKVAINGGTLDLHGYDQTITRLEGSTGTLSLGDARLTLNQSEDTSFGGAITGTGEFVKNGSGTFTYSGTGSMSGTIDVAQGAFHLTGHLNSAKGIVQSGADFYGTGSIGGLQIFGRLAAGNEAPQEIIDNGLGPATGEILTVNGDLTFETGSMLLADMAADGTMTMIHVSGTTTINGGTVNVLDDDAAFDPKGNYVLIHSSGGVVGTFDGLVTNLAFYKPWLTYTGNEVRLTFALDFDPQSFGENAGNVGSVISDLSGNQAPGPLNDLTSGLTNLNDEEAERALWSIAPEIYSDASAAVRRLLTGGDRMITQRFTRDPSRDVQFWTDYQFRAVNLGYDGNASSGESKEHHQIFGADATLDGAAGSALLGVYGGFVWADLKLDRIDQHAGIKGPLAGLYGQWSLMGAKFYGRGSVALPRVAAKRRYASPKQPLMAEGAYRMMAAGTSMGFSYDMAVRQIAITPFAEIGAQYLSRPRMRERDAGDAGLIIQSASRTSGDARIGARFSHQPLELNETWNLAPALSATYVRSLGKTQDTIDSAFIGAADKSFPVLGVDIGRDAANLALNLELAHRKGFANMRLGYGFNAARHERSHTLGIAGSLSW